MKTAQELKTEAIRLRDQLHSDSTIDLKALREFWKDLEDYIQASGGAQPNGLTLADFDWEIISANAARRRLHAQLFDLINQL
jgi:hypothetical protein